METRANYILIGLFTLATIVGVLTFIYWFEHITTGITRMGYRVVFEAPVSGLRSGAPVTFNGVRVGEVNRVDLNPTNSRQAIATIFIDGATPIRANTVVSLEFQGLTGIPTLALRGGTNSAGPPTATDGDYLVLVADATATQDVTEAARTVLRRLDGFISENEALVKSTLKNVETFSQTLSKNSERIDRILSNADNAMIGVERLTGGPDKKGELADTLETFRQLATSAVRDWHTLAADGRRAINSAEQVFKNIDRNPSRLIFGGSSSAPAESAPAAPRPPRPAAPRPQQ
jgi:phospholipid/cholesterol/gamma-HCH transport system substrate-binding protein